MRVLILIAVVLLACALPASAAEVRFEPDLEIGDEEPLVQHFSGVVVDSRGHIFVVDGGLRRIHEFADDGSWLSTFGQPGEGPGDVPQWANIAIDGEDRLILAGLGSRVDLLDTSGAWLAGFQRENPAEPVRTVTALPDGGIMLTVPHFGNETAIDLYGADFAHARSIGATFCAGRDANYRFVHPYLGGIATVDSDGRIIYLQLAPYELRIHDDRGTLLAATRDGAAEFVPEPPEPEVDGDRMTFSFTAGTSGAVALGDGTIVTSAYARDGESTRSRVLVHGRDLDLLASAELVGFAKVLCRDDRDRVFLWIRGEDESRLTRNRLVIE